jgi:PAS domain S-box-containing protein
MYTRLELYQLVTPLANLGIWERDLETGVIYWNEIIRDILEVPDDYQPSVDTARQFYKDPAFVRSMVAEVIRHFEPRTVIAEIETAKGNSRWIKMHMRGTYRDGKCVTLYGTLEDITRELTLNSLLEEREQQFSQAFENAPIGMALVGLNGSWIRVNASLCELLGYQETDLCNLTFQDITHPEDLQSDLSYVAEVLSGKRRTYSMEKRYIHKQGYVIWALLNVSLVRNDAGDPLYFISQIKNITQSKQHEETIRYQNERLLNFAHIVSHNLRSHSGNITTLIDLISVEQDNTLKQQFMEMLHSSAHNLLNTISELNAVVDVQSKEEVELRYLNLHAMVERVRTSLSAAIILDQAVLENRIDPAIHVMFNPAYLESIFGNLITNSLKYKYPHRLPHITISSTDQPDHIEIKVADNGSGIDMKTHGSKLFRMYKTFHGNKDARGVGLFLVKNQLESLGGNISVESTPNEGSVFSFTIPKKHA